MKKMISNSLFLLKYILKYCSKYVLLVLINSALMSVIMVVNIHFQRHLINSLGTGRSWEYYVVIVFALWLINILCSIFTSWLFHVLAPANTQKLSEKMQELIYEKALTVDYSCFEDATFYDLYVQAIQQSERRSNAIIETLSTFVRCVVSFGALFTLIGTLDPLLIVINLLFAAVAFFFNKRTYTIQHTLYKERIPSLRSMLYAGRIFTMREYAKELRLHQDFPKVIMGRFRTASNAIVALIKTHGKKAAFFSSMQAMTNNTSTSGIMFYLAYKVINGSIQIGDFVALTSASQQIGSAMTELLMVVPQLHEHSMYINSVRDFLAYTPLIVDNTVSRAVHNEVNLSISNLSFTYPLSEKAVLKNINISIKHGEKIAFVGKNGAGKSTLAKLMVRLYDPSEGSILINGIDYKEYGLNDLRKKIGILLQDYQIYATTIAENVLMRPVRQDVDEKLVREALEFAGLYDRVCSFGDGIYSFVQREFSNDGAIFSGGQLQKLALARVYAQNPSVIILDEPSSALDPYAEFEMFQTMFGLMENKTVILTSHRLANVKDADRIYFVENGEIAEFGSHEELMTMQGKYCEMFTLQASKYREPLHSF